MNENVKPEQKESTALRFDNLLKTTIEQLELPDSERDILFDPGFAFGRALMVLRERAHISESELADMVNMRMSDIANAHSVQVSTSEIIDLQAGTQLPDERLLAKLVSVLKLDEEQARSLLNKKTVAKEGLEIAATATTDALKKNVDEEVFIPLTQLLREHNANVPQLFSSYKQRKFVLGGHNGTVETAAEKLDDAQLQIGKLFIEKGLKEEEFNRYFERWHELNKQYIKAHVKEKSNGI